MPRGGTKGNKGGGRKLKHIDVEQVQELFEMHATIDEVCRVLRVCNNTFQAWVKRETEFNTAVQMRDAFAADGKMSLRRMLFKCAKEDPGTLRFLAKNLLGMADKIDQKTEGSVTVRMDSNVADNVT